MSDVSISWPPEAYPANISGSSIPLAVYNPAVYPAGPEPMMMTLWTSAMWWRGRWPLINLENEIQFRINAEVEKMSPDEISKFQENINEKYSELKDKFYESAKDSVKLTFIIDELAKREKIQISDKQLIDIISYQALMEGQNPEEVIKDLKEKGMLPLIKMNIIEAEVISTLLKKRVK
jgi:hypothetical protein